MKRKNNPAKVQKNETTPQDTTTLTVVHNATDSETANTETPISENPEPQDERTGKAKTVKEIIEKNFRIQNLIEQHETLNQTAKKLDSFKLGSDRLADSIVIKDGRGNEFRTNNTPIIGKVVEMIRGEVDAKSTEVEEQIQLLEAA